VHLQTSLDEDVVGKRPVFPLGGIAGPQTLSPFLKVFSVEVGDGKMTVSA